MPALHLSLISHSLVMVGLPKNAQYTMTNLVTPVGTAEGSSIRGRKSRGIQAPGGNHAPFPNTGKALSTLAELHLEQTNTLSCPCGWQKTGFRV